MSKILDNALAMVVHKTLKALHGTEIRVEMWILHNAILTRTSRGVVTIDSPKSLEQYESLEEFEEAYTFLL